MKGLKNALKTVIIMLALLCVPLISKAASLTDANGGYQKKYGDYYHIDVQNKKSYIVNMKVGEEIKFKFWLGSDDKESIASIWNWTVNSGDENAVSLNKGDVKALKIDTVKATVKNGLGNRQATITFNITEDPLYIVGIEKKDGKWSEIKLESNIKGDLNCDGLVTNYDLYLMKQYISDSTSVEINKNNADIYTNGSTQDNILIDDADLALFPLKQQSSSNPINTIYKNEYIYLGIKSSYDSEVETSLKLTSDNSKISTNNVYNYIFASKTDEDQTAKITVKKDYGDNNVVGNSIEFYIKSITNEKNNEDYEYIIENNKVTITKYKKLDNDILEITDKIDGYDVYKIDKEAFSGTNLKEITIPKTVLYIDSTAFNNCTKLEKIEVSEENPKYYSRNGILYSLTFDLTQNIAQSPRIITLVRCPEAYKDLTEDGKLILNDNTVKAIGHFAFYNCKNIKGLELPESISVIGARAFYGLSQVSVLTLPNNISSVLVKTDVFTGIAKVVYNKTEGEGENRKSTETFVSIESYKNTCEEKTTTVFEAQGEDLPPAYDGEYKKIEAQDGKVNLELQTDRIKKYKLKLKIGDKVEIVPSVDKNFTLEFNSNNTEECAQYAKLETKTEGTILNRDYSYFITALKATPEDKTIEAVLKLSSGDNYKAYIKIEITEPDIYIFTINAGNPDLHIKGDLNADNLLSSYDLEYYDYIIKNLYSELDINRFDINGDGEVNATDLSLFKKSNVVYKGESISLYVTKGIDHNREASTSVILTSSDPTVAEVIENDRIIFKKEGNVTISAHRVNQSKTDTIDFVVTTREQENEQFKYLINKDNTITISEYIAAESTVLIPGEIDGKKVTKIGADIFKNNENKDGIKQIVISENIQEIDYDAFNSAKNIEKFEVDEENKTFIVYQNVLYKYKTVENDAKELILFKCPNSFTSIEIPEKINEKKVTEIGTKAFYNNENITSIKVTNNIEIFEDSAFEGCTKLSDIDIPNRLRKLGNRVFANCIGLYSKDLSMSDNLETIGKEVFDGAKIRTVYYYYKDGVGVLEVYLSDNNLLNRGDDSNVRFIRIEVQLEDTNTGLLYELNTEKNTAKVVGYNGTSADVTIEEKIYIKKDENNKWVIVGEDSEQKTEINVTEIGGLAFAGSEKVEVETITIKESIKTIEDNALRNLPKLKEIRVLEGNANYYSNSGILYKKNIINNSVASYSLIKYPEALESEPLEGMPYDVTTINNLPIASINAYAFEGNQKIKNINIGANVVAVGNNAFSDCTLLENLVLPNTITQYGQNLFQNIKGPVIAYSNNGDNNTTNYLKDLDGDTQSIIVYANQNGLVRILAKIGEKENPISKIKFLSSSSELTEVKDLNLTVFSGFGKMDSEQNLHIIQLGGYEVVLIDKNNTEIKIGEYSVVQGNDKRFISYYANIKGASNVPEITEKEINKEVTISSTIPTLEGKEFVRWDTKADGTGTTYLPGAKYTGNEDLDLYAIWKDKEIVIQFNDENMYNKVVAQLGDKITEANKNNQEKKLTLLEEVINNITYLNLSNRDTEENLKIVDITGIEKFKNLKNLNLGYNKITNISALSSLEELNELDLCNNQIIDISALENHLRKLVILDLSENKISNIDSLSGLNDLQLLVLDDNKIGDISKLTIIPGLEVFIRNNKINVVTSEREVVLPQIFSAAKDEESIIYTSNDLELTNCTISQDGTKVVVDDGKETAVVKIKGGDANGTTLTIEVQIPKTTIQFEDENLYNQIVVQLEGLIDEHDDTNHSIKMTQENIDQVTSLSIYASSYDEKITSIAGIENFNNLTELELCEHKITDISALSGLKKLTSLSLSQNQITDISALNNLTELTLLALTDNQIENISALGNLTKLIDLQLSNNQINEISALRGLINLEYLYLDNNRITRIDDYLSDLAKLTYLDLSDNQIRDISSLNKLPNLTVDLMNNKLNSSTNGNEIPLPQIFIAAKEEGSKIYTNEDLVLNGCTISEDGTKVIFDNGKTLATVEIKGGRADGTKLMIDRPITSVTGITLDVSTLTLEEKTIGKLKATVNPINATNKAVTWSSSDETVTTVDQNGNVTAVAQGTATITVKSQEDETIKAECTVTVNPKTIPVTSVAISRTSIELIPEETENLTVRIFPNTATNKNVTWSSSDEAVATVDQNGNVTAVAQGTATITVKSQADETKEATCTVRVTNPISPDPDILTEESTYKIEGGYLKGIKTKTSIDTLKDNINDVYTIQVLRNDGKTKVTSGNIGTGMRVEVYKGTEKKAELIIIIKGDITGDGLSNGQDILDIILFRRYKKILTDVEFEAADITEDGKANGQDILEIILHRRYKAGHEL